MELIFAPLMPFVGHPERIGMVSVFFLISFVWSVVVGRFRPWLLLVATIGWALFAVWEWHCRREGFNIRVDLFLIYPALFGTTVWAIVSRLIQRDRRDQRR